jgi:ABC-2 type transport system ATP-binding protein
MIGVKSLTKSYGSTIAVDDMSFVAHSGRVTGLLGRNGAGKSTTLRILLGLSRPDHGSATFDGTPYRELADPLRTVGAILEDPAFHPGQTGLTHLRALACAAKLPTRRVEEVLGQVELSDAGRRRVGGYSLGMRQRLGLAAAMIGNPATLVLDEPQNGLDPQGIQWLRLLLRRLAAEGRTVLVSSHVLAEVAQLADDAVIVAGGRVVSAAPIAELLQPSRDVFVGADRLSLDPPPRLLRGPDAAR